jgi:hypothetical protein
MIGRWCWNRTPYFARGTSGIYCGTLWVRFSEIVRQVLLRGDISNNELVLSHAISGPVEPHVGRFAALFIDAVSCDSDC